MSDLDVRVVHNLVLDVSDDPYVYRIFNQYLICLVIYVTQNTIHLKQIL